MWLRTLWLVIRLFFTFIPLWAKTLNFKSMCVLKKSRHEEIGCFHKYPALWRVSWKSAEDLLKLSYSNCQGCWFSGWQNTCLPCSWRQLKVILWGTFHNTTFSKFSLNPQIYTLVSVTLTNIIVLRKNCYGRHLPIMLQSELSFISHRESLISTISNAEALWGTVPENL